MPWTPRQKRYLLSNGSPLSAAQKDKMKAELHADPSLGHAKKGSSQMKDHGIREIRIEVHRSKGKITGHTVHHHMVPKPTSKSHAFMEHETSSYPFSAHDHKGMMAHVHKALAGSAADVANANENEVEDAGEEEEA